MRIKLTAILVTLTLLLTSCATVFKGGTQTVPVNSEPPGAEIIIDNVSYGTTPTSIRLDVDRSYAILLRSPTGEERTFQLRNEIGTLWIILDVVTGLVPIIVDAATGDWYELKPGEVFVSF